MGECWAGAGGAGGGGYLQLKWTSLPGLKAVDILLAMRRGIQWCGECGWTWECVKGFSGDLWECRNLISHTVFEELTDVVTAAAVVRATG